MAKIGFIYSTVDGHTLEICRRLIARVEEQGFETTLQELTAGSRIGLDGLDRVVIGASIRYGKHRPEVARFINENADWLASTQSAFFSVNAVARKPEKKEPHTNPYVRKFLKTIRWQPAAIGIFGGKIHYAKYRFWDRTMIRFIMWMTKGPTAIDSNVDFTNWDEVDAFGKLISGLGRTPA
ncbi:MAG: menaquinone-dependent protoporphyrinogen IX dehydrogenase [Gammaproteobacteria bacterium]|nr:menaquinone-dependent protoporphyrinogen IX dehydrogenase [Gammaproteobacteria bacterium]